MAKQSRRTQDAEDAPEVCTEGTYQALEQRAGTQDAEDAPLGAFSSDTHGEVRPTESAMRRVFADSPWASVDVAYVGAGDRAKVAGISFGRETKRVALAHVFEMGESYVRALAEDDRITVRFA